MVRVRGEGHELANTKVLVVICGLTIVCYCVHILVQLVSILAVYHLLNDQSGTRHSALPGFEEPGTI